MVNIDHLILMVVRLTRSHQGVGAPESVEVRGEGTENKETHIRPGALCRSNALWERNSCEPEWQRYVSVYHIRILLPKGFSKV